MLIRPANNYSASYLETHPLTRAGDRKKRSKKASGNAVENSVDVVSNLLCFDVPDRNPVTGVATGWQQFIHHPVKQTAHLGHTLLSSLGSAFETLGHWLEPLSQSMGHCFEWLGHLLGSAAS